MKQVRSDLNAIRAIAVVSVIINHIDKQILPGGFLGVDLFLVLSGFFLSESVLSRYKDFKYGRYLIKRTERLYPLLITAIIFTAILSALILYPADLKSYSKSQAFALIGLSNYYFASEGGYFDVASELKPLHHLWSLSLEIQVFLLLPLILVLLKSINFIKIRYILSITILGLIYAELSFDNNQLFSYYDLGARFWEFMVGVLASLILAKNVNKFHNFKGRTYITVLAFVFIFFSFFSFNENFRHPGFLTLIPISGLFILIIFDGSNGKDFFNLLYNSGPVRFAGINSYALYLFHYPLLVLIRYKIENKNLSLIHIIFYFLTLILLVYAANRYIEEKLKFVSIYKKFIFLISSILILFAFSVAGYLTNGFIELKYSSEQNLIYNKIKSSPFRKSCHSGDSHYISPENACTLINGEAPASWAVFGDSHGVELSYELGVLLKNKQNRIRQFTYSGCPPRLIKSSSKVNRSYDCTFWTSSVLEYLLSSNDLKNIVIIYRLNAYLFGGHERTYPYLPSIVSNEVRDEIFNDYVYIINTLAKSGKNVYVVLPIPELPNSILNLISRDNISPLSNINGVDFDWWIRRSNYVNANLYKLSNNINLINPADLFCSNDKCFASINSMPIYFDDNHLSTFGASILANEIISKSSSNE